MSNIRIKEWKKNHYTYFTVEEKFLWRWFTVTTNFGEDKHFSSIEDAEEYIKDYIRPDIKLVNTRYYE